MLDYTRVVDHQTADGSGTRPTRNTSSATKPERPPTRRRLGPAVKASLILLVIGGFLTVSLLDIGPAWSAKLGLGTHGTFTAEKCWRTKTGCFWTGTFVSDNGQILRADVGFDSKIANVGQQIPARDTGDRVDVYPMGGGWDWLWTTILLVVSLAALALWILVWLVWPIKERRMRLAREEQKTSADGDDSSSSSNAAERHRT